ncbi:hypothetical protein [Sphingomonas sp. SUN039]|uniref:hypothetical protein n=1 Tax=Sphingomonas sp. SUN039 TaxID=2937787 RepID=UPI0021642E42|nr:hypothetical protein [Sphingomonas sp. SUN039]UVO53020.1 hypothetical protein M0209_02390 [Sphingomonas sp. SUN039]
MSIVGVADTKLGVSGMIPESIATKPQILETLLTPRKPATRADLLAERVSYIYGNLPGSSEVTRDKVYARLTELEGSAT